MDQRNSHLWSLGRRRGHRHLEIKLVNNLVSITGTTRKPGWQLSYTRNGFNNGTANWESGDARLFFYKITSLATSFQMICRTFTFWISNQTSQCMSNQWTRALSGASRLIIVKNIFNLRLVAMRQASLLPRFMTSISLKPCGLLISHGMKWIRQLSETVGKRPESCLTWTLLHQPNPLFRSHHYFTPLPTIRIPSQQLRMHSEMPLTTWKQLAHFKAGTGWTSRPFCTSPTHYSDLITTSHPFPQSGSHHSSWECTQRCPWRLGSNWCTSKQEQDGHRVPTERAWRVLDGGSHNRWRDLSSCVGCMQCTGGGGQQWWRGWWSSWTLSDILQGISSGISHEEICRTHWWPSCTQIWGNFGLTWTYNAVGEVSGADHYTDHWLLSFSIVDIVLKTHWIWWWKGTDFFRFLC